MPGAHQQALEIAHELEAITNEPGWHIMVAIAFQICQAHAQGKPIRSFGFIAERLVRAAENGDNVWLYDLPRRIDGDKFDQALDLAGESIVALRVWLPICEEALASTTAIECLAGLIDKHTLEGVMAGISLVLQQLRTDRKLEPGLPNSGLIWRWDWFNGHILKAQNQAQQAADEQRWKNAQALRRAGEANRRETVLRAAEAAISQLKKANIEVFGFFTVRNLGT